MRRLFSTVPVEGYSGLRTRKLIKTALLEKLERCSI